MVLFFWTIMIMEAMMFTSQALQQGQAMLLLRNIRVLHVHEGQHYILRAMMADDIENVAAIYRSFTSVDIHFRFHGLCDIETIVKQEGIRFLAALNRGGCAIVAEYSGEIVGAYLLDPCKEVGVAELSFITHHDHRSRRLAESGGKALIGVLSLSRL